MKKIVLLLAACANEAEAKRIGRALVRLRLAACVNIVPRVDSVFRWKRKTVAARESVLVVKTTKARAAAAAAKIKALHSYELPSVEVVEASVEPRVFDWVEKST